MSKAAAPHLVAIALLVAGCHQVLDADYFLEKLDYVRQDGTEHFEIYVERDDDEEFCRSLREWLEETYEKVGALLESFPEEKTTVKIYSSPLRPTRRLEFFGYAGKEAIYSKKYEDTRTNLAHEYTHFLAARVAEVRLPAWFNEGLATFVSNHLDGTDRPTLEEEIFRFVHGDFLHDHSALEVTSITRLPEQSRTFRERYAYGSSFISFLVKEYGFETVLETLRRAKEAGGVEAALSAVVGEPFETIDEGWVRYIRSHADPGRYVKYGLIRDWYVIGPFDNNEGRGFARSYIPEGETVDLSATYPSMDQVVRWRKVRSNHPVGYVNLHHCEFSPARYVVAYAATVVRSPRRTKAVIRAGADESLGVWLNGESLFSRPTRRGFRPDEETAEMTLEEGENFLLLKAAQSTLDWRFTVRITDEEGDPIPGLVTTGE